MPRLPSKSKRKSKGAPKQKKKGTLSKKQQSQTKDIVKKEMKKATESKYFNCAGLKSANALRRARSNVNFIGVRGYAICENKTAHGIPLAYGFNSSSNAMEQMDELNMNRTFQSTGGTDHENTQAVVGCYATPSLAISDFILERNFLTTEDEAVDYDTADTAPYFVRVLRLAPRASKLSTVSIEPNQDAFVNELGQPIGISDGDFGPHELMLYKANARKYKVIADKSFTLVPPMTASNVATGQSATDPLTETAAQVTNIVGKGSFKRLTMKHDIGKKLYFEEGGVDANNSQTGQKNEFILFHTCQIGVNSQASSSGYNALNMVISGKFVSTFKDL